MKKQNNNNGMSREDKILMITGQLLYSDKEIQKLRWCWGWLLGPYCFSGRATSSSYCFQAAGHGTNHPGKSRCSRHGGSSTGPKNKRMMIMNKLTKLDKRSKLSTEIFNEKELKVYEETVQFIKENYDITDELAISQIARLFIYQTFLLDKLHQGYNVSIENSSKLMKEWLNEYGLTPRSKVAINLDGADPGLLARVIIDVHGKMEAKRLQEQEDNTN